MFTIGGRRRGGAGGPKIAPAAGPGRIINPSVHYRVEQTWRVVINHPELKGEPTRKQKTVHKLPDQSQPAKTISARLWSQGRRQRGFGKAVLWCPLVVRENPSFIWIKLLSSGWDEVFVCNLWFLHHDFNSSSLIWRGEERRSPGVCSHLLLSLFINDATQAADWRLHHQHHQHHHQLLQKSIALTGSKNTLYRYNEKSSVIVRSGSCSVPPNLHSVDIWIIKLYSVLGNRIISHCFKPTRWK